MLRTTRCLPAARELMIILAAVACVEPAAPLPSNSQRFTAPPVYQLWWSMVQACSGHTGNLAAVEWYVVPGADSISDGSEGVAGYWSSSDNRIVLIGSGEFNGPLVRHEMLHALVRVDGHPRSEFVRRCGGVVDCRVACVEDAGPPATPATSTPRVPPDSLELGIEVQPAIPGVNTFDGYFTITVTARNPSNHPRGRAPPSIWRQQPQPLVHLRSRRPGLETVLHRMGVGPGSGLLRSRRNETKGIRPSRRHCARCSQHRLRNLHGAGHLRRTVGCFTDARARTLAGIIAQHRFRSSVHVRRPRHDHSPAFERSHFSGRWNFQDEKMKKSGASQGQSASELISKRIAELGDWRGETLGRMRKLIKEADPDVVEEWKWMGTPVWSHDGIICTGESYKKVVKLTFAKGASLKDPARLFNSSLDGNVRRAIDIHEGEKVDESAFKALVRQAVALNSSGKSKLSESEALTTGRRCAAG
jgi:hypothetical protein